MDEEREDEEADEEKDETAPHGETKQRSKHDNRYQSVKSSNLETLGPKVRRC